MVWDISFHIECLIVRFLYYVCELSYNTEFLQTGSTHSSSSCNEKTDADILTSATVKLHCFHRTNVGDRGNKLAVTRQQSRIGYQSIGKADKWQDCIGSNNRSHIGHRTYSVAGRDDKALSRCNCRSLETKVIGNYIFTIGRQPSRRPVAVTCRVLEIVP